MPYRAFDGIAVRCPQLGSQVSFGYCRQLRDGLPCQRALACFAPRFPVAEYFRRVLREETYRRCFAQPGEGRYEALLRVFRQAKSGS